MAGRAVLRVILRPSPAPRVDALPALFYNPRDGAAVIRAALARPLTIGSPCHAPILMRS